MIDRPFFYAPLEQRLNLAPTRDTPDLPPSLETTGVCCKEIRATMRALGPSLQHWSVIFHCLWLNGMAGHFAVDSLQSIGGGSNSGSR